MSKYTITIEEEVPSNASPLEVLMHRRSQFYSKTILTLGTDLDLTAEIAKLVKEGFATPTVVQGAAGGLETPGEPAK